MLTSWVAQHQQEIWSLAIVIITGLGTRLFRIRPKLYFSFGHAANLLVEEPLFDAAGGKISDFQTIRTGIISVGNVGLLAAKSVEVTYNYKPRALNVFPPRAFQTMDSALGRHSVKLDSLAPGEWISIEVLAVNGEVPIVTAVRSEDSIGKARDMELQRKFPAWFNVVMALILLLGATSAVYLLISLVRLFMR